MNERIFGVEGFFGQGHYKNNNDLGKRNVDVRSLNVLFRKVPSAFDVW